MRWIFMPRSLTGVHERVEEAEATREKEEKATHASASWTQQTKWFRRSTATARAAPPEE
jgi:hypothetical protein